MQRAMQRTMWRTLTSAVIGACAAASMNPLAFAQAAPEVTLTRFDCGTSAPPADVGRFSDIFAHRGLVLQIVYSCYLIKHGDEYTVWDTGHSPSAGAFAPKVGVVEQLQLKPEQISYVGIVLITGDLAHFRKNYDTDGVPPFNTNRAESLASLDRVKKIAANTKATIVIQHDARDVGKLPAFPASAN